jgi:adenylate cyclase
MMPRARNAGTSEALMFSSLKKMGPKKEGPAKIEAPLSEHVRTARIMSGLVLFYYVFVHLSNHALGNISLDLMEKVEPYTVGVFRRPLGTWLLGGAALTHFCLALWAVYTKRRFRMPLWEATQLILGFLIPLLLLKHFVAARVAREAFGAESDYSYVIWGMRSSDWKYVLQTLLLTVAWAHGSMGIHYWLRFRAWYPKVSRPLAAGALLLPVVALLGFLQAVREVSRLDADPRWHRAFVANAETIGQDGAERLAELELNLLTLFGTIGIALLGARLLRQAFERRRG